MTIPYRTKQILGRVALTVLILLVIAALLWGCWILWSHRFIVYTRDEGAVLDFDLPPMQPGETVPPDSTTPPISIYYNEGDNAINTSKELTQIVGYYVEPEALLEDMDTVFDQIRALPTGTPVMVDVKNIYGSFYYSSSVSAVRASGIDSTAMDELIELITTGGKYAIARLPALRDKDYGLNHDEDGVFHSSRGYLWMDDVGCYWLNPSREGTVTYLTQITTELKNLGFDEVVYTDFCFPPTDNIYVEGDKAAALQTAANTLVTTCATESFAVSFVGDATFQLPEGRCRLYVENAEAAQLSQIATDSGIAAPEINLVFLTNVHDTRFDAYSVLRPLSAAH